MQAGDLLRLGFEYRSPTINNNNGNVLSQTIARLGFSATQTYTYDDYNRIQKVQEGSNHRDFQYKEPGNMYVPSSQGTGWAPGSFTPTSPSWFNAKNQLVNPQLGITYDVGGNLTAIGGFTFAYDAENRLVSSTLNSVTTNYVYDGEGRRVKKGSVVMVYDAFGRLAAEYGGTAAPVGTEYLTADHLGSTRLVTSSTGAERRCLDYLPFGEQMTQGMGARGTCYTSANEPRVKFTGKERDAETGLDFFGARYFSGAQGRFTSPDEPFADQYESEPQSWNLYSYSRNNPLRYIDPTGRKCIKTDSGSMADDGTGGGCEAAGVDPNGSVKSQKVEVQDIAPPSPELLALTLGIQRAAPVVNAAAVGTAVIMTGGFAGMGYGAIAGGAGLQQLGVAAGPAAYSLLPELGRKLDYLFGLARGSVYNIQRSTSMLSELQRVGLNDTAQARTYVQAHLGRVLNDASSIVSQTGGRTVRESFLMGPTGGVKIETVWEGTKLITMKVLGGER
jgi:RHS repeat-associated protein